MFGLDMGIEGRVAQVHLTTASFMRPTVLINLASSLFLLNWESLLGFLGLRNLSWFIKRRCRKLHIYSITQKLAIKQYKSRF